MLLRARLVSIPAALAAPLLAALLALGGCKVQQSQLSAAAPDRIAEGRRIAEVHCSTCHAIGEAGESRHPAAPPFRTLSHDYPVTALEEAFAEGILVGHPDMPEFKFEPKQIDDLVAYLQSIQPRQGG